MFTTILVVTCALVGGIVIGTTKFVARQISEFKRGRRVAKEVAAEGGTYGDVLNRLRVMPETIGQSDSVAN